MFNRNKRLLVLLLFSGMILSMSFVSASDNVTDDNPVLGDSQYKSFEDLDNEINSDLNKSEIILESDYINTNGTWFNPLYDNVSSIFINRSVSIDGQGHVIDANWSSRIFYINADNVVLKNIVFKKGSADIGGAIYCSASNLTIINSTFINSWAFYYDDISTIPREYNESIELSMLTHWMFYSDGGSAIVCEYNGTIINSTFIDNYLYRVYEGRKVAVALNLHNESISYGINCMEVFDSVRFNENYTVIFINSTFKNVATYPRLLVKPVLLMNSSNDNNSLKSGDNKIKKSSVKFIAKNKVFSKKTKNKKYSVILKNSKNKKIKNTWVTLKIKGKTLKAKTNSKGKATFKIKINKKGTYKTTIKFKGNTKYKSLTKKIKIKIK